MPAPRFRHLRRTATLRASWSGGPGSCWRRRTATAPLESCLKSCGGARPSKPTVWRWQARYLEEGVSGLKRDKIRLSRETRLKLIARTVQESPPNATHWSRALMAAAVSISPSSVGRIRAQAGLKPHLTRRFKVSNDPLSEEKVTDIVGLCLDPPEPAIVLCVDEKSRIQALDRTRPGRPLRKRRAATMTHDDKRHGTTTLFAALDVKSGMVIGECRRAPPSQGVPEVPAPHRPCRPVATRRASGARQLRHPQDTRGAGPGWRSIPGSNGTSRRPARHG